VEERRGKPDTRALPKEHPIRRELRHDLTIITITTTTFFVPGSGKSAL
jgi:hypothetical protein